MKQTLLIAATATFLVVEGLASASFYTSAAVAADRKPSTQLVQKPTSVRNRLPASSTNPESDLPSPSTKLTISIPEFKNDTTYWWWRSGTARELADALSNELTSTGKFSVVERQKLGAALSEQELAELNLVRRGTGAKKGQLTGSKYVVLGQITAYEEGVSDESTGGRVGGINIGGIRLGGRLRRDKQQAYLALDLRVVDTTTGEVVHARTIEGRAESEGKGGGADISFQGVNLGGDREKTNRAPVGKALRAALVEATDYLSCVMVDKGNCLSQFEAKEQKRRDNTRGVLKLE